MNSCEDACYKDALPRIVLTERRLSTCEGYSRRGSPHRILQVGPDGPRRSYKLATWPKNAIVIEVIGGVQHLSCLSEILQFGPARRRAVVRRLPTSDQRVIHVTVGRPQSNAPLQIRVVP